MHWIVNGSLRDRARLRNFVTANKPLTWEVSLECTARAEAEIARMNAPLSGRCYCREELSKDPHHWN